MEADREAAAILQAAGLTYLVVAADGRVQSASPGVERLLGRSDVAGLPLADLLEVADVEGVPVLRGPESRLARALGGDPTWHGPLRGLDLRCGEKDFAAQVAITPLGMARAAVTMVDVGAVRELLEAHESLLSMTSHELKTPLTAIKAMSELMMSYDLEAGQRQEMITDIFHQAERLEQIIREILDATRLDSGNTTIRLAPVDLRETVVSVLGDLSTQLAGRRLTVKVPASLPAVMADRGRLEQVIVNLLTNAIKYSPDGSPISVKAATNRGWVRVEVTDRGIGIREEDLDRLFKKFERIHDPALPQARGTGLGLFIVRGLVELMSGTVEVTSKHGQGSTFALALPTYGRETEIA